MSYSYDQIFAADPANPSNIARNAAITIYQPGDPTKTPLVITDPSGGALTNPVPVNANGFGSAFMHATLDRVAWDGGGFTGFFTSYEGMKNEAVDARTAAQEAAATAGADASAIATAAIGTATDASTAAAADAATAQAAASASATAAANSAALVGAPADSAIAAAINGSATATKTALNAAYAPASLTSTVAGKLDSSVAATTYASSAAVASAQATARLRSPIPPTQTNVKKMVQAHTAGHGFTVTGTANVDLNDTTDFLLGTQSVRATTAGTGALASIRKTGMTPIDFTGADLRIWFKFDSNTTLNNLRVYIGDDTFANNYNKIFHNPVANGGVALAGEWAVLDIPLSSLTVVGTPNRAAITAFSLSITEASGQQATVRLGGFAVIPQDELNRFPNGVVSFTFDDSFGAQYSVARPYLDLYGYRGTLFPIINLLDTAGRLTSAQVSALNNAGWEVAAHATTTTIHNVGIHSLTQDARRTELEALRQWNADNGYMSTSFAYPLGTWNEAAARDISRYYTSARLASTIFPATARLEKPYRVVAVNAGASQASLNALADQAKAAKGHLCVIVHDIKDTGATGNDISTVNFKAFVDYVAASGMAVRTYGEVVASATA